MSLFRLLGRLILDTLAFIIAAIAAAAVMMAAIEFPGLVPELPPETPFGNINRLSMVALTAMIVARMTFLPAVIAIIAGEVLAVRSVTIHLAAGMAVVLVGFVSPWTGSVTRAPEQIHEWTLILAAGAVAGFAYWLVAGRSAGILPPDPVNGASPASNPDPE